MGKRKQRISKPTAAVVRERSRLRTDLIGHEDQHLVNTESGTEMGGGNVRQLQSHKVPIPVSPVVPPPERSERTGADSIQLFDPGIQRKFSLPLAPPPPPPPLKAVSNPRKGSSPQADKRVRPNLPPKPGSVIPQGNPGVSSEKGSEMESVRLALDLQDRERQTSRLSESDEDVKLRPVQVNVYDDGEVQALKRATPPSNPSILNEVTIDLSLSPSGPAEGANSPSAGKYLTPAHPMVKPMELCRIPPKGSEGETQLNIESELGRWPLSGIGRDGRYYSYDKGDRKDVELIGNAIVYHPSTKIFVRVTGVTGRAIRKVVHMPITMDQLIIFKRFPCYICFDAAREPPDDREELTWDSFQTVYTDADPTYETPQEGNRYPILNKGQGSSKLNSFGNLADLIRRTEDSEERDVDHLLDVRTRLQDQLWDLSSESNDEEGNLPKTIGEHQMPYLTA